MSPVQASRLYLLVKSTICKIEARVKFFEVHMLEFCKLHEISNKNTDLLMKN